MNAVPSFLVNKPKFGGLDVFYSVAFFQDRLVLVKVGQQSLKSIVLESTIQAVGGELAGTLGRAGAAAIGKKLVDRIEKEPHDLAVEKNEDDMNKQMEELLGRDKSNFQILYAEISRVEMKKAGFGDRMNSNAPIIGKLALRTTKNKEHKFYILEKENFVECEKTVRSFLSRKLESK